MAALTGHHNLRRAGQHVDGAIEGYEPLGRGDVEIARPHNLVHALDVGGSIGQSGYGVRAAQAIELRDAEQVRGGECLRRGPGRDHNDAFHTRHLCGNGSHQQRGGQRMAAAGHIAADRGERTHKLAGGETGDRFVAEGCGELFDSKTAYLFGRSGQRLLHCRRDGLPRGGHLVLSNAQIGGAGQPVEFGCVAQQSAVALFAHVDNNAPDGGQHAVERRAAALGKLVQSFSRLPRASSFGPDQFHRCLRLRAQPCSADTRRCPSPWPL